MVQQIGDGKITISAEDKASAKFKGIERSLDSMGKQATKAGLLMVAAGVAIMAGLFKMADSYTKAGDEVAKMAKRTGWGTEALSEMRYVAQLAGTSLETIEKASKRMASTIEDAKDGLETYTRSFDKLGLSVDEVAKMAPEEQFWAIANAIAELEDPTMRAALAQDFFGRAGTDLLPILSEGTDAIIAQRQQAHELGLVFTEEAAAAAEAFQDAITELKGALVGLGAEIIEELIPHLQALLEQTVEVIGKIKDWAEAHPDLAKRLWDLGVMLAVGGIVLVALGNLARAIVAINSALIIMHALAGPAAWAKLLLGLAAATGLIIAMQKYLAFEFEVGRPPITPFPHRGVALPLAPSGELTSGLRSGLRSGVTGGATTVNITMGHFLGDEASRRELVRMIKDGINQDVRRTSFPGVNVLGYYPGSSSI